MLSAFDPLVSDWFTNRFGNPTEPQIAGWREIRKGRNVLISAPTGSGKTLAAFLSCLDSLVRAARANVLADETQILYVSPLKALSNDVQKNLDRPLAEIAELAALRGVPLAPIRTAVRTGDTPAADRQRMRKQAPHILVTTPESLFILLTAEKSREMLRTVRTVIVDEIHAVVDDKRGAHLSLTLARLDAIAHTVPQKIGLSATVRPIEDVGAWLAPGSSIVNTGHRREMDLAVEVTNDELGAVATSEMWEEIYDRLAGHILRERTTLVFVNTRRLSERVAHALAERLGPHTVLPHHGSLSRALRYDAEARLKNGELRAVVATASLELGIDIGTVDLAIQIGSPRSIAVALQRIGRSGHWVGAKPRGIFFPTTRDELIECAAIIEAIRKGDLERIEIPQNALDILAQQIVAETSCETWGESRLYDLIRTAYPYRNLPLRDYDAVLEMLSEGIATSRGRSGALLHRDRVNRRLRGRRGAKLAAITSGGAIPDSAAYSVIVEPEGRMVGTVDEDFAVESLTGDVFLLGTQSWRVRHVGQGKVRVEDAHGAKPSLPFWLGEAPGRSAELSAAVSRVREELHVEKPGKPGFGLDEAAAQQAIAYVRAGVASLGALPSVDTVVAERFFDESGGTQLILHAPFGSRINRAWGLALRKRFCRMFNFELQAAATDNGIAISLSEQHAFPLETVFEFLRAHSVEDVLREALLAAPMFGVRWRWNASRALTIPRFRGATKVPPPIQRMRAEDLLASVFPDQVACAENLTGPIRIPDHPLVNETISNCLHEAMDVEGLKRVLSGLESGAIRRVAVENPRPSVFSHEILNANPYAFLDDAPLEERRARAVQLRSSSRADVANGILDPAAIDTVSGQVWPQPRDADELHDALLTFITGPAIGEWRAWFEELNRAGRAFSIDRGGTGFWVATERRDSVDDTIATVRGWMECLGPVTATELAARIALNIGNVRIALAALESEGQVFEGWYRQIRQSTLSAEQEIEWCNRRILARIHHLTLGRLRREIAPVAASQFHQFLLRWQHVAAGTQLHGADGVLQILRQLQGFEVPASAWEETILSQRIAEYGPENLDDLCLSGEVAWARLSPHPALGDPDRHVRPTRIAPISFFAREDADWLIDPAFGLVESVGLSHAAREVFEALSARGASFFGDLVRDTRRLPSEVEDALWELTSGGLVTADGFENLRALIDPKRRRGQGRANKRRPRHAAGRWALVTRSGAVVAPDDRIRKFAGQLLLRWGVLFRDLLARETVSPAWRDLLPVLRRMEAQGEIRGGRFVDGFTGEQFARPEAIELLRVVRRADTPDQSRVEVAPADPLNLAGIILPGARVSTVSVPHLV